MAESRELEPWAPGKNVSVLSTVSAEAEDGLHKRPGDRAAKLMSRRRSVESIGADAARLRLEGPSPSKSDIEADGVDVAGIDTRNGAC